MSERDDFQNLKSPIGNLIRQVEQQLAARGGPVQERARDASACARCGGRGYVLGREGAVSVAHACGCESRCAKCNGRGFLLETRGGYQFQSRCECQTLAQRIAAYNGAQIPGRFADKGFENFYVEGGGESARELMVAKRELVRFADTARPGHTRLGIGLLGGPGRGKTHLLAATLSRLTLGRGVACRYVEISFLFADLKAAISDPRARATVDKIDELAEVDVLAIDELGKGRGSTFEEEVLDELIGRRYNNGRLTLFATNYPREGSEPTRDGGKQELWHQSLRTRVGERVYSRLHEMVAFIEFSRATPDRRIPG